MNIQLTNSIYSLMGCDTLKMEAPWSSETLVYYHITTWHQNTEDCKLNLHHCENLESHNYQMFTLRYTERIFTIMKIWHIMHMVPELQSILPTPQKASYGLKFIASCVWYCKHQPFLLSLIPKYH